jgi:hypothetical protein
MQIHLMQVPDWLQAAVEGGSAIVDGAVVKDMLSGQILAHLQPTQPLLNLVFQEGLGMVSSPLSLVSDLVGNAQLLQLQRMVEQLQLVAGIGAAASVLNLGVSVGGFAMVLNSLKRLDDKVDGLARAVASVLDNQQAEFVGECQAALRRADEAFTIPDTHVRHRYWNEAESTLAIQAEKCIERLAQQQLHLEGVAAQSMSSDDRLQALARAEVVDALRIACVLNTARAEALICLGRTGQAGQVLRRTAQWLAPLPCDAKALAQVQLSGAVVPPSQLKQVVAQAKRTSALIQLGQKASNDRALLCQSLHEQQVDTEASMLSLRSAGRPETLVWAHTLANPH